MLLGEAPGKNEAEQLRPFVGRAGQLLQETLQQLPDVGMEDLYITNVIKHRPPDNRDPRPEEIDICGTHFLQELEAVNPKIIVCLGRVPTQALARLAEQPPFRGSLRGLQFQFRQYPVLSTWHPAYILRRGDKQPELLADLQQAFEIQ